MILFFNNPYDVVSCNTRDFLFVNSIYPMCVDRISHDDDRGFWISFLPTVILCKEDGVTELARIEDYVDITADSVQWLIDQYQTNVMQGKPIDASSAPAGVIIK